MLKKGKNRVSGFENELNGFRNSGIWNESSMTLFQLQPEDNFLNMFKVWQH